MTSVDATYRLRMVASFVASVLVHTALIWYLPRPAIHQVIEKNPVRLTLAVSAPPDSPGSLAAGHLPPAGASGGGESAVREAARPIPRAQEEALPVDSVVPAADSSREALEAPVEYSIGEGEGSGQAVSGSAEEASASESGGSPVPEIEPGTALPVEFDRDAVLAAYISRVRAEIDAHKTYPQLARRLGQEGSVRVQFVVSGEGTVSDVRVVSSSGFDSLDQAAIETVKAASPVSPPPPELGNDPLVLSLTLSYSL